MTYESSLFLSCARTSVTWPRRRLPLGMTAPPALLTFAVVLTMTASPTFADLESSLPTSSAETGRSSAAPATEAAPVAEAAPAAAPVAEAFALALTADDWLTDEPAAEADAPCCTVASAC